MMQLVSSQELPERPSCFDRACRILGDNLRRDPDKNYLWTDGRWVPASLDEIMRRANQQLKAFGRPQFTNKREWIIV
jgi:hypothetical protein